MAAIRRGFFFSSLSLNIRHTVNSRMIQIDRSKYCSQAQTVLKDDQAKESQKIDKIRDISGLPYELKCRLRHNNRLPQSFHDRPNRNIRIQRDEQRKQYAMLGKASGIDPAVLWDTKEEYREKLAEELNSHSLEEALRLHLKEQTTIQKSKTEKIENVKLRMEVLMPEVFEQIYQKQEKARQVTEESSKRMEKMNELLEEARDYLGYEITRRDPEFAALMEKLKLEEKEAKKRERRAQKLKTRTVDMGKSGNKPSDDEKVAAAET